MNIYHHIPPQQPPNSYVSIDIEIFGMNSKTLHRPTSGKFACLSIATSPEDVYMIHDTNEIPMAMYAIKDSIWVAHHSHFDLTQLRRWDTIVPRKKLWDTLLIDRILYGGYFDTFSLADLARRHLNIYMEKETRDEFRTAAEMDERMIQYAALDASITLSICHAQQKVMTKNDFKIWSEVDCPALWSILDFKGMAVDIDEWMRLFELNKQRAEEIKTQLPFNPNSPKQVKEYLETHGFKGLKSSEADVLEKQIKKYPNTEAAKLAQMTLDCRTYAKRANTYGETFITDHVEYDDGIPIIFPDWNVTGAATGRMSCSSPSLQNIPERDTKEFRKCFVARPGNTIVVVDYSAQEPRITAHLSQDKRLLEIFRNHQDVYCEMAWDIYGKRIQKSDPLRNDTKPVFLGAIYGLTPYGLAKRLDCSVEEAEKLLNKFFKVYSGVDNYVKRQVREKKYVQTVLGRKYYINTYSEQGKNNTLNSPVQGTAGDMIKKAVAKVHREWKFEFPFCVIGLIHDEMIADAPKEYAEEVGKFMQKCMIETGEEMCPSVPFEAKIYMGSSWACKE